MESGNEIETGIVYADRRLRKWAVGGIWALAAFGTLLLVRTEIYLQSLRDLSVIHPQEAIANAVVLLKAVVLACSTGCLGFGLYLLLLGRRVHAARQFPPPGMRVLRDTQIVAGPAAEKKAKVLGALAVVLIAAGVGSIPLVLALISRLLQA